VVRHGRCKQMQASTVETVLSAQRAIVRVRRPQNASGCTAIASTASMCTQRDTLNHVTRAYCAARTLHSSTSTFERPEGRGGVGSCLLDLVLHGPCLARAMPTPPRSARWDQTMSSHHVLSRLNESSRPRHTRECMHRETGIPRIRSGNTGASNTPSCCDTTAPLPLTANLEQQTYGEPVCEFFLDI